MIIGFFMRKPDWLAAIKGSVNLLSKAWRQMAGYMVVIWSAEIVVLSPLISWVLNRLVARSGEFIVGNQEIIRWLLTPEGLLYVILIGSFALLGLILQLTGLFWIADTSAEGGFLSTREALTQLLLAIPNLFRFCLAAFLMCILCLIPLVVGFAAVYLLFLKGHDINYYLTNHPPAWRWALTAGGFWGLLWACGAGSLFIRVIYALPIWLDVQRPLRRVLGLSWEATRGSFIYLFSIMAVGLASWVLAQLIFEGGLYAIAGIAVRRSGGSVHGLFFVISVYLVLGFIINTVLAFLVTAWSACALTVCYRTQQRPKGPKSLAHAGFGSLEIQSKVSGHWIRSRLVLGALVALLLMSAVVTVWQLRQKPYDRMPLIIAHRAGAKHAPENSMSALRIAIQDGADYAEIDVQRSFDGVVIVAHDRDLMKIARDPRQIGKTNYADLAKVDIGRNFHSDFTGERLAKLSDFFKAAKGRIKLMIELKYYGEDPELASEVLRLVAEFGMGQEISIISLKLGSLRQVQRIAPDIPVGYLASVNVGNLLRLNVNFLAVSSSKATSALIRNARGRGMPVYAWTVNDVDGMLDLIEGGVDGLITDDPALASKVISQVQGLVPTERLLLRFRNFWDVFDARIAEQTG
jgi:glycerophosphoryl diester phosphodiesterase